MQWTLASTMNTQRRYTVTALVVLLWGGCIFPCLVAEVAYVLEPFESAPPTSGGNPGWYQRIYNDEGKLDISVLTRNETDANLEDSQQNIEPLHGDGAFRIDYTVASTASWGGFVDFGWINTETDRPHNCHGATHLSLWYNNLVPQTMPGLVHLRLILLEDSNCDPSLVDCSTRQELEHYYSFHYVLDDAPGWQEIRVELQGSGDMGEAFWRPGWAGQVGNNRLDLNRLRGWRIELNLISDPDEEATESSGLLLVDQLSCQGGGDLLGAAFWATDNYRNFQDLKELEDGTWHARYYESPFAQEQSQEVLHNGILQMNYTVEETQSWGGFSDLIHLAPGNGYYNLSDAQSVSFSYSILESISIPNRAHLRFILMDSSDCETDCSLYPGQNDENYYSFHFILEGNSKDSETISIPLQGSDSSSSPFWRPGWTGILGNNALDRSDIKGFRFEINVDSQGELGSSVSGALSIFNLTSNLTENDREDPTGEICTRDASILVRIDPGNPYPFERIEFVGNRCCEWCESDPGCLYSFSDGRDCYISPLLPSQSVGLVHRDFMRANYVTSATNNKFKRGDYCMKCRCLKEERMIDCRGQNLTIAPSTFEPGDQWLPQVLDLRENPHLAFIDERAFDEIQGELEELRLPTSLRHISEQTVMELGDTVSVSSETGELEDLNNAFSGQTGLFGDICCSRGNKVGGLTFCDMKMHEPGIDSVYEPFAMIHGAASLDELIPRSQFMGEAAASVEKCAEYCAITESCRFFAYDARWKESEHTCFLYENEGSGMIRECCGADDYADEAGTLPGWTSGRPPRTRHERDDARVMISNNTLVISQTNSFTTQFQVSLGSSPLRGAVWIEPLLSTTSTILNIDISPRRAALYDLNDVVTVRVSVTNREAVKTGERISVMCHIDSCDAAFTSISSEKLAQQSSVHIDVVAAEDKSTLSPSLKALAFSFVAFQGIVCLLLMCWTINFRDRTVVRRSQPVFLIIVTLGCLTTTLSILPTAVDDGEPVGTDIVDASCMLFPWLFNLGFILTFSALFAKLWRVKRIIKHAQAMRRVTVRPKDVAIIIVAFTSVPFVLMLAWQLVSPLHWERDIVKTNEQGYTLESHGFCTSDKAVAFVVPLAVYNFSCLVYALFLCYVTRDFPTELQEGKWITASIISIFQALLLAMPALTLAWDDPNAFFFLRASIVVVVSFGVLCFIFIPKVYLLHFDKQSVQSSRISLYMSNESGDRVAQSHHKPSRDSSKEGSKNLPDIPERLEQENIDIEGNTRPTEDGLGLHDSAQTPTFMSSVSSGLAMLDD